METNISRVMSGIEDHLDMFDNILRYGHAKYDAYPAEIVVDHDASTQAHCTYRHILSEAQAQLAEIEDVRHIEVRGQNLWLFEEANVVCRFKKTDKNGVSSNYLTKQARAFDCGEALPGLPVEPTRLTIGYLLDPTGSEYVRSQVSLPTGKSTLWCAAIVPQYEREESESSWFEITNQGRLAI